MRQVDASDVPGVSETLVGFVEAYDIFRGTRESTWTEHRYHACVHRRPAGQHSRIATCPHEHRDIDTADRCLRRLLRRHTRADRQVQEVTV